MEFASHVDAIRTAEYLGGIASKGEPVAASKDAIQWWGKHQIADRIVSLCDKAVDKYKSVLKTEIQEGKDIAKAGKASIQAKPTFHEDEFRQKYPHLWEAHLAPPTVGGRFVVTKMKDDELLTLPEVAAEILVVAAFEESIGEYAKNQLSLDQLSSGYIQFLSRTEYYRTRELLANHYLMSICGDAPEIIGVCKWNRTEKPGKLDRESLRAAAPSEFAEFVSVTEIEVINLKRKAGSAAADEGYSNWQPSFRSLDRSLESMWNFRNNRVFRHCDSLESSHDRPAEHRRAALRIEVAEESHYLLSCKLCRLCG